MQHFLFFVGISGKTVVLHVAPNICNNCYNRLFIGFESDDHHMSMKCCFINMLHGVMKCARHHKRLHRHFGLFWVVCVGHHKRFHCQFATCCCDMLLYCICFMCQVDSVSWDTEIQDDVGLHMHRRTGAGGTTPVRFSLCVMQW